MSSSAYYVQECPTCGRTLQVRVEYLGKKVTCQHCGASLRAVDAGSGGLGLGESGDSLLARAEELIETAALKTAGFSSGGQSNC